MVEPAEMASANATSAQIDSAPAVQGRASQSSEWSKLPEQVALTEANLPIAHPTGITAVSGHSPLSNDEADGGSIEAADGAAQQSNVPNEPSVKQDRSLTASSLIASKPIESSEEVLNSDLTTKQPYPFHTLTARNWQGLIHANYAHRLLHTRKSTLKPGTCRSSGSQERP